MTPNSWSPNPEPSKRTLVSLPQTLSSFHQFCLLPGELQNLIWDHAATTTFSPQINFFIPPEATRALPGNPVSYASKELEPDDHPLPLVPHPQSACLGLVSLSLTCQAARAAVCRRNRGIQKKTILRISYSPTSAGQEIIPRMNLILDLSTDLICLGGPGGGGMSNSDNDEPPVVDYMEGNHILFAGTRRLAMRYERGWDRPSPGSFHHDVRCPALTRVGGESRFCSLCVARLIERFDWLEEVYLIVDGADAGDGDGPPGGGGGRTGDGRLGGEQGRLDRTSMTPRVFKSYTRTYFSVDKSRVAGATAVGEATAVLRRIKANMMVPGRFQAPWVRNLRFELLTWRDECYLGT